MIFYASWAEAIEAANRAALRTGVRHRVRAARFRNLPWPKWTVAAI